jgi:hypothetical protein
MSETIEIQGRAWQARELEQIRQWVKENPTWSRYRLSRELCVGRNWVRPNGQLADMAARSFLNKLQERGLVQLPACRRASPNRMKHRQLECVTVDSSPMAGDSRGEPGSGPARGLRNVAGHRALSWLPQLGGGEPYVFIMHRAGSSGGGVAFWRGGLAVRGQGSVDWVE